MPLLCSISNSNLFRPEKSVSVNLTKLLYKMLNNSTHKTDFTWAPHCPTHTSAAHSNVTAMNGRLWKRDSDPGLFELYDEENFNTSTM